MLGIYSQDSQKELNWKTGVGHHQQRLPAMVIRYDSKEILLFTVKCKKAGLGLLFNVM